MRANIHRHVFCQVHFIFDVEISLVTDKISLTQERIEWVFLAKIQLQLQRPWRKLVTRYVAAKANEMTGIGCKVHVDFCRVIFNA